MKKSIGICVLFMLLICCGFATNSMAQNPTDKSGALTIPWVEFKHLLNLEEDEIVVPLETFQKLLAQTGITFTPSHSVSGGNVVLTRAEFINLVNKMKTPTHIAGTLPFEYLVTKAIYSGSIQDGGSTFKGDFVVHVLKEDTYLKVPVLPLSMALEDVTIDGEQTLVVSDNGYHNVILSAPGEYHVRVTFSLKSLLNSGPNKIDLSILQTPMTLMKIDIPLADIDVEIPQAQKLQTVSGKNSTSVTAVLGQGNYISILWHKKVAPADKVPPKLYSELHHLLSIDDDALKVSTDINLNILYSEINEVIVAIPTNMNVLSVTGEGIGEWQEVFPDEQHQIRIPFTYGKKGQVILRMTLETALTETGLANLFSGIGVLESVRETGYIGIELNTSAEVLVSESEGLEPVAVQKLPPQLINKSTKPLMLGFKNLKQPYSLVLDIKKHRKVAVPMAAINTANVVTLFTEDGKIVNRLVYQVRNNAKQFLEIDIPEDADVWSVYVDNQPVESSINSEGKLLVPLIRSRVNNNALMEFPVEVVYCQVNSRFSLLSMRESSLPAVDLLVSQLIWSVYLPTDYTYHHFSSTLEKEEMISTINILSTRDRRYNEEAMRQLSRIDLDAKDDEIADKLKRAYEGKEYTSNFRNLPMEEAQIVGQLNAELEFGGRMEKIATGDLPASKPSGGFNTGVLPIQIRVPTTGHVYRFAKTIVKPEDPLSFNVTYSRGWVAGAFKWVVLIIVAFILYLNRRKFLTPIKWLGKRFKDTVQIYKKHRNAIDNFARSTMAPVVLLGLVLISWPFSRMISILALFLFWISAAYQLLELRKRRMKTRPKVTASHKPQSAS